MIINHWLKITNESNYVGNKFKTTRFIHLSCRCLVAMECSMMNWYIGYVMWCFEMLCAELLYLWWIYGYMNMQTLWHVNDIQISMRQGVGF